jgi:haloacetate dehalogenase
VLSGVCEDYRAAAGIDLDKDRADDATGHKIRAPLLALWGAKGTGGQLWDVLAAWRPKTQAALEGQALPGSLAPPRRVSGLGAGTSARCSVSGFCVRWPIRNSPSIGS